MSFRDYCPAHRWPHPQPFDLAQAMGGGANQKVVACQRINLYHLKYGTKSPRLAPGPVPGSSFVYPFAAGAFLGTRTPAGAYIRTARVAPNKVATATLPCQALPEGFFICIKAAQQL